MRARDFAFCSVHQRGKKTNARFESSQLFVETESVRTQVESAAETNGGVLGTVGLLTRAHPRQLREHGWMVLAAACIYRDKWPSIGGSWMKVDII
jgi:hypothetical protein